MYGQGGQAYEEDLAWCYDAVNGVSRTFAITVDVLEEPMASRICVGYLLCRIADTVEDAGHIPADEQIALLETYSAALDPASETEVESFREDVDPWLPTERDDDWTVVAEAPRVVRTFEAMPEGPREAVRPPVRELVGGMATFIDRHAETDGLRIRTVDELEEYCWYAAGTVGDLITNLVSRGVAPERARTLRENAESFALLLQLVNVAKDVQDDYTEENNVYIPQEWLDEEELDPEQLCDPDHAPRVAAVVERVTDRAAGYLDDAQQYLEVLPETRGNTLAAWAIPYLLAVGTIRELRTRPEDVVVEGDVKVPREEVFALIARFESGVDHAAIGDLRRQMERQPLHQV